MNTIKFKYKKRIITRELPSEWNELNSKQLIRIASIYNKKLDVKAFRIFVLFHLLNIKRKIFNGILLEYLHYFCNTLQFFEEKVTLHINLLPFIRIKYRRLYGPSDKFTNLNIIEFGKAEGRFLEFKETQDVKYLDEMIAILYRPKKFLYQIRKILFNISDKRQKYSDNIARRTKQVSLIDYNIKFAIFLVFEGCRNYIIDSYPLVFTTGSEGGGESTGWGTLIIEMAGPKFGNVDQTAETLLHTILMYLSSEAKKAIDRKRNRPK